MALDGGKSGFDAYEKIAGLAPKLLKNEGYLLFEAGFGQAQKIVAIGEKNALKMIDIFKDLAGTDRCVIMQNASEK